MKSTIVLTLIIKCIIQCSLNISISSNNLTRYSEIVCRECKTTPNFQKDNFGENLVSSCLFVLPLTYSSHVRRKEIVYTIQFPLEQCISNLVLYSGENTVGKGDKS